jgi:hypothetical protein
MEQIKNDQERPMRYTSAKTAKELRAIFPEAVEIPVPAGGWLTALRPMHEWSMARTKSGSLGVLHDAVIGRLDVDASRDLAQFCFSAPADADEFHKQFGGTRIRPAPPKPEKKPKKSSYRPTHPIPRAEPVTEFSEDT